MMDKELYKRFIDTTKEGKWIKSWWFNTQAKRIMSETYPEHVENLRCLPGGLQDFFKKLKYCYEGKPMLHKKTPQ